MKRALHVSIILSLLALMTMALPPRVRTQTAQLLFGSLSGVPTAVTVTSAGAMNVVFTGGTAQPDALCINNANKDVCLQRGGAGILNLTNLIGGTTFTRINFGTAISSNPALKANGTILQARLGDDSGPGTFNAGTLSFTSSIQGASSTLLVSASAPTISSGFGTSPTIPNNNGSLAFTVNVGTGGTATAGIIAFNNTAPTGWVCDVNDITAAAAHVAYNTRQTASSTTTATLENQTTSTGAAVAWAASDILRVSCTAY